MKLSEDLCIIVHNGVNEIESYLGKRGLNFQILQHAKE